MIDYALFICTTCPDEPGDECDDRCAVAFPDELDQAGGYWPACSCCGRTAQLVAPLVER